MSTQPSKEFVTFANPAPQRDYEISITSQEFTCLCPMTGQPDFAELRLSYVPDKLCVELKSFKLYLWSFRDQGAYHEAVTNEILDYIVAHLEPRRVKLEVDFNIRGGIRTVVQVNYDKP